MAEQRVELPPALEGERRERRGRSGRWSTYVSGTGPPMLLLHSINAAGSAYEIRPIFERFAATRRVFAPDLPGFGFSERSNRDYDVRLFVDAVHDVLDEMAGDCGDAPVDALALSLTSEFLARAAAEAPARFRSLAFITPTGFGARSDSLRAPEGRTAEIPLLYRVLTLPLVGRASFGLLTRPASIRYFLRRTWGSDSIDEGLADYDDRTTRQPGAEHAPLAFISGRLFSRDIRNVYEALRVPAWLAHGTRGDFRDFRGAGWVRRDPLWRVDVFDTGALPHFEVPDTFCRRYAEFLESVPDAGAV